MVDAKRIDGAFFDEAKDGRVPGLKNFGILDSNTHQFVDIEEAPVIDLLGGLPPVSEAVSLRREQHIEAVEGSAHTFEPIKKPKRLVESFLEESWLAIKLPKLVFELRDLRIARIFFGRGGLCACREVAGEFRKCRERLTDSV